MNVYYRKGFLKELERVSQDVRKAFAFALSEIKAADSIVEVSNVKKLQGKYLRVYRLRVQHHRAIFVLLERENGIEFLYISPRGEAYSKKYQQILRGL